MRSSVSTWTADAELKRQLQSERGKASYYKGLAAEYRLINRLMFLGLKKVPPQDVFSGVPDGLQLGPFSSLAKRSFHLDQARRVEVDIFGEAEAADGWELVVEVKDHHNPPGMKHIQDFLQKKTLLADHLKRPTVFLFYSERGFTSEQVGALEEAGVLYGNGRGFEELI